MYAGYFCTECEKPFARVNSLHSSGKNKGKLINPLICPHCDSTKVITSAEYQEFLIEAKEKDEKKKLADSKK